MSAKKLSTGTCHVISSYGNTANNVIHAYRAGGEHVATQVRHLSAKSPVSSPQAANKFNDLGQFLIQK